MTTTEVQKILFELADKKYKLFTEKINPTAKNIIGVRIPKLKEIAKQIKKSNYKEYLLANNKEAYFEEILIQGLLIGYLEEDIKVILKYVEDFIPKINDWAVCDIFCSNLKTTKYHKKEMWEFLLPYFKSDKEYFLRFAIVMSLSYYIDNEYKDSLFLILDNIKSSHYYVNMAIAWALSVLFIKFPENTLNYLKTSTLNDFTYNKTLSKITDSLKVDKKTKDYIKTLRKKKQ